MKEDPKRFAGIVRQEEALAAILPDRLTGVVSNAWIAPATAWSRAVWDAALALGPAPLADDERERGYAAAQRPIFLCGAHRSGTTLLRDLLEGHPAIAVLPSEGTYYTSLERKFAGLAAADRVAALGMEWLRRLANPINQPPYWLLGRSDSERSRYVDFAREWLAWSATPPPRPSPSWPLAALALAWGRASGNGGFTRWAEKTPGNEFHLARIWRDFPDAQVLHVLRDPAAVLASHAALIRHAPPGAHPIREALRDLARSCRIAERMLRDAPQGRYHLVRYERLAADRDGVMRDIAAFLGIEAHPKLLEPSVAGLPASRNTSFTAGERPSLPALGPFERWRLDRARRRYAGLPGAA